MKRLFASVLAAGLLMAGQALAQSYRFQVQTADVTVTIDKEGTADIEYELTFRCSSGAHAIDIVDIGMPNRSRHGPVSASINNRKLPASAIKISSVLKPRGSGYEIALGSGAIRPGRTGVFRFRAREQKMVWQDTTDPGLVAFRFTPTWFGSQYVEGDTQLLLRYRLPIPQDDYANVKDRILWHKKGEDFTVKGVMEGEDVVCVGWNRTVRFTGPNPFSVSFPKEYVTGVRKMTVFRLFYNWFAGNTDVQVVSGIVLLVLFGIIFFTATRTTGCLVYVILAGLGVYAMVKSPGLHLCLYPVVLVLGVLLWWSSLRKKSYFPAEVCREGGGIKRGLTAVEAAILLELPLTKVLTMVVFALAKKELIRVTNKKPLKVETVAAERSNQVWMNADGKRLSVRPYEGAFLRQFALYSNLTVEAVDLSEPAKSLINHVASVMKGFDFKSTQSYYRSIVSRAWKQVEHQGDFDLKFDLVDRNLDWLMIDEDWSRSLDEAVPAGHYYRPIWWYGASGSGGSSAAPRPVVVETAAPDTSFSDVANSITGRFETASSTVISGIDGFAANERGGIDLSAVDTFTKEAFKTAMESSGSGGGCVGGGCACACAGCACACACAGGGR